MRPRSHHPPRPRTLAPGLALTLALLAGPGLTARADAAATTRHGVAADAARPAAPVTSRPATPAPAPRRDATADSTLTLKGDQEGTVFRSLTIEGEDRIHYDFERPPLIVSLDPTQAPGLDWGTARDVLDRTRPDATGPLLAVSARAPLHGVGEPWRQRFATGAVATFRPEGEGVTRWRLTVADAHGEAVASFEGSGAPPAGIPWDGRTRGGDPVTPGLTYSYVFEATDRAGNKRHFLGDPFVVDAFRLDTPGGPVLVFSGRELIAASGTAAAGDPTATPILAEAASWLDQGPTARAPIRVVATARTRDQADRLASLAQRGLVPRLLGDPARVSVASEVRADAPADGALRVGPMR